MGDEGEKTCPLCAEEMDLTDQQLKPCKCGYQICVWCWHHIIEMAEKDETEGRCPACRTSYDKEKIVGMAANCERLVAEVNTERKKPQKAKPKPSEGRKQLSSVRVIQRNLVYVVGLPINLADEDLLQRKEYFGQYGKVLKASMSRTAAGVVQQFPNNTFSVYITYSKEEEAIRCIQSVHGFVLDGRSLKACFGTTKYCHAWLRNLPCTNPDCLYLHEIGSQEDSFTKDEIISAYTRCRVQQIPGMTNNLQRRSGSMLPSPVDDHCNDSSTAKSILKVAGNNTTSGLKDSPSNGTTGRSVVLPAGASWGIRSSNHHSMPNSACSNEPPKQKAGGFVSAVATTTQVSVSHTDVIKKSALEENGRTLHVRSTQDVPKPLKLQTSVDRRPDMSEKPASPDRAPTGIQMTRVSASVDGNRVISMPSKITDSLQEGNTESDGKIQSLCTHVASMNIDRSLMSDRPVITRSDSSHLDRGLTKSPGIEVLQQHCAEEYNGLSGLHMSRRTAALANETCVSRAECDVRKNSLSQLVTNADSEIEDVLSFNSQRLKDPEIVNRPANLLHMSNHMHLRSSQFSGDLGVADSAYDSLSFDSRGSDRSHLSHGYTEKPFGGTAFSNGCIDSSSLFPDKARNAKPIGKLLGDSQGSVTNDTREDSIISNILSLDFDESLTSPQSLAKLLGDTDKESTSLKLSNSWKVQNYNQSKFSFARQEESKNQAFESYSIFNQMPNDNRFYHDSLENRDPFLDKLGVCDGLSSSYFKGSDNFIGCPAVFSSNKLSSVPRAPVSVPPGFSVPSRSPPPGFSSNERIEQTLDTVSGNRLLESSLLRNSYQTPSVENLSSGGDIELMDPAILAVGQRRLQPSHDNSGLGLRSNFSVQFSAFENEAKLQQLLLQNPLSPHHSLRYPSLGEDNNNNHLFSLRNSYGISSRLMDQSQGGSFSPFPQLSVQQQSSRNSLIPNNHWDGWNNNGVHGGNRHDMAEIIRNERLGFNKFYGNC